MTSPRNPLWATSIDPESNLFRITDRLYRSEQPLRDHAEHFKSLGIRTVISLRAFHSDDHKLRNTGITLHRIPMHTWRIHSRDVAAALRHIEHAQQHGAVLIHCLHGADRTGLVAAMYRMIHQGWSKTQALDELKNGGYGFHSIWKNIPHYLHRLDLDAFRQQLRMRA